MPEIGNWLHPNPSHVVVEAATVDLRDLRGALKSRGRRVTVEEMAEAVRKAGTRLGSAQARRHA